RPCRFLPSEFWYFAPKLEEMETAGLRAGGVPAVSRLLSFGTSHQNSRKWKQPASVPAASLPFFAF
ncbi:MAG: hypothetical protein LBH51_00490, partial [Treponema sp.]|nr:hypothetical protein [Treponema sp.]